MGFIIAFRCSAVLDRRASSIMESISNLTINVIFGTCTLQYCLQSVESIKMLLA